MTNFKFKNEQSFFDWLSQSVSQNNIKLEDIKKDKDGDFFTVDKYGVKKWLTEDGEPHWYNLFGAAADDYKKEFSI